MELGVEVTKPNTEDEPATTDVIQTRNLLRHINRVKQSQQQNTRAQLHVARLGRQTTEQRYRLQGLQWVLHVLLPDLHGVEAVIPRDPSAFDQDIQPLQHRCAGIGCTW